MIAIEMLAVVLVVMLVAHMFWTWEELPTEIKTND